MKIAFVVLGTTIVQVSISEALYADAAEGMRDDPTDYQSIQGLLAMLCSYVLATVDHQETASAQSQYVLDNINKVGVVAAVAALWRHNSTLGNSNDPVLVVPLLQEHKNAIQNARGLVKEFAFGHLDLPVAPHVKIPIDLLPSAIN